jgi:hypothetical protein
MINSDAGNHKERDTQQNIPDGERSFAGHLDWTPEMFDKRRLNGNVYLFSCRHGGLLLKLGAKGNNRMSSRDALSAHRILRYVPNNLWHIRVRRVWN